MGAYQSTHTGQEIDTCLDTYLSSSTLPAALAAAKTEIINAIYPVGSIYMNINNTNPNTLFGGTWVQIEDTFLLACGATYTAGDTGGEAEHTLVENEVPAHTHARGTMNITGQWKIKGDSGNAGVDAPATGSGAFSPINETASGSNVSSTSWNCGTGFNFNAANGWSGATSSYGGGLAHNNMPPYLAVYVWKRTA